MNTSLLQMVADLGVVALLTASVVAVARHALAKVRVAVRVRRR